MRGPARGGPSMPSGTLECMRDQRASGHIAGAAYPCAAILPVAGPLVGAILTKEMTPQADICGPIGSRLFAG